MDERDATIQHLKNRDQKLREAIEQLVYQDKKKRERAKAGLHDIRVKLVSLKWAVHLLSDTFDSTDDEERSQLSALKHAANELARMVTDLSRTLDDPA